MSAREAFPRYHPSPLTPSPIPSLNTFDERDQFPRRLQQRLLRAVPADLAAGDGVVVEADVGRVDQGAVVDRQFVARGQIAHGEDDSAVAQQGGLERVVDEV